ncbi:hypothetical protein IV203_021652 [Nitzschia inconspicua]|uniref:Gamma-glutamylcyclotransferase AIG2-like domain-containing protein n=1 Tax=Nitzschia inconspicua TaxID=303405 RepID=A0A9K3KID2_9STRA|nr:hypothetical protein IV203_021652 [Nitzschia inconspicua]
MTFYNHKRHLPVITAPTNEGVQPPLLPTNFTPSRIYYFGYGPIVHPLVRHRRGVPIASVEAAVLYEHRLTFQHGGLVHAQPQQRGYQVYGVLLNFDSIQEWQTFAAFDEGAYRITTKQVYSLKTDRQVTAYTFVMDIGIDDGQSAEALPQERYLHLMAEGLKQLGDDIPQDYIDDELFAVPYNPKTKDYRSFPQEQDVLQTISQKRYQRLCRSCNQHESSYFIIGRKVIKLFLPTNSAKEKNDTRHCCTNPCAKWIQSRFHGKPDGTLFLHQTVVDPELSMVDTVQELTHQHFSWAEHYMVEYLEQGGLSAKVAYYLEPKKQRYCDKTGRWWWSWLQVRNSPGSLNSNHSDHSSSRSKLHRRGRLRSKHDDDDVESHYSYSSNASSNVALHHISRTRRQKRIQRESLAAVLFNNQKNDMDGTAAEGTYFIEDDNEDDRLDDTHNNLSLILPHVIVRHDCIATTMDKGDHCNDSWHDISVEECKLPEDQLSKL